MAQSVEIETDRDPDLNRSLSLINTLTFSLELLQLAADRLFNSNSRL